MSMVRRHWDVKNKVVVSPCRDVGTRADKAW